ncbi:MAG: WYL domain-containing protein [Pseudomonadota bacterium]|nr:WYL domain-containing protein [Pseudomonadota bacterium]
MIRLETIWINLLDLNRNYMGSETRRINANLSSAGSGRWSVEQRLLYIEQRLFWRGTINRSDIISRYEVSVSQASADINRYLSLRPQDVSYDKSAKCYVAGVNFKPLLAQPDTARVLGEFRLVGIGLAEVSDTVAGEVPPFDSAALLERAVDPWVLRAVWQAIAGGKSLQIDYQSLSRPGAFARTIEPHALAHDGFRWHARAFDRETGSFRDFVLARMSFPHTQEGRTTDPAHDSSWNTQVELRIAPHPELTPAQASAIRRDYGIEGDYVSVHVRQALLFYALKRLGLDTAPEARAPNEQHIVLLNREQIFSSAPRTEPV